MITQEKKFRNLKVIRESMLLDSKLLTTALEIRDNSFVNELTKRLRKNKIKYDKLLKTPII